MSPTVAVCTRCGWRPNGDGVVPQARGVFPAATTWRWVVAAARAVAVDVESERSV